MDAQELRNLQEAYIEVHQVDEAIRNPESRKKLRDIEDREVRKGDKTKGENPRSKYPTEKGKLAGHLLRGPESTGSKGNPVRSRGGTNAPSDERVGRGPHRAGNAKYWAGNAGPNRDRGSGNANRRRRGIEVPNTRDVDENYDLYDIILSHLLDEGYAETPEAAEAIMVNMSEEWRESIVEEMKLLPKERMRWQAERAYKKETRAASSGDEKETNRQMQRRIAMQDPRSRRNDLRNKKKK